MLRVGKLTDMALERTLRLFLEPETLIEHSPTLRMLATPAEAVKKRAAKLKKRVDKLDIAINVRVIETASATGGGSLPGTPIRTFALALSSPGLSPDQLNKALRHNEPPIIARISEDEVLLDLRTVFEDEEPLVLDGLRRITERRADT